MRKEVSLIRYAIFVFHIVYTNKDKDLFFFLSKGLGKKKKIFLCRAVATLSWVLSCSFSEQT